MAVDLVKTTVRLGFAEALRPWLEVRQLFRVASGNENVELQGESTYVEREQEKQRFRFQTRALSFEQEGDLTGETVIQTALEKFADFNSVSPLPTLERVRIDSLFIEPFELPFQELRSLIGQTYLQPNSLAEQATDIAVILEQEQGHVAKFMEVGPMEPKQLQETYLHWQKDSIPEQFVFIGLGYQWNVEMEFNIQELHDVLVEAQAWQESTVQLILSDIRSVEGG